MKTVAKHKKHKKTIRQKSLKMCESLIYSSNSMISENKHRFYLGFLTFNNRMSLCYLGVQRFYTNKYRYYLGF